MTPTGVSTSLTSRIKRPHTYTHIHTCLTTTVPVHVRYYEYSSAYILSTMISVTVFMLRHFDQGVPAHEIKVPFTFFFKQEELQNIQLFYHISYDMICFIASVGGSIPWTDPNLGPDYHLSEETVRSSGVLWS